MTTAPEDARKGLWVRMPVWARLASVLAIFIAVALLPSGFTGVLQGLVILGFAVGVIFAIARVIARKVG